MAGLLGKGIMTDPNIIQALERIGDKMNYLGVFLFSITFALISITFALLSKRNT
jgi:hypothetical protein